MSRPFGNMLGNGALVREYLTSHPSASVHELWRHVVDTYQMTNANWKTPTYESFRMFLWKLKRAGLITEDHREIITEYDGQQAGVPRTNEEITERIFYRIVEGRYSHPAWNDVTSYLYGLPRER